LRTIEANCAVAYFRSWVGMPVKWRGTSRRPIPDNWRSVGQRSSPYHLAGNRNAAHPVNAILNYAYATLESEIRIKTISEGYDPTIGIMHEGRDGSSKFIFDLMEPERPRVDRAVLDFVRRQVFDPADFVIRTDGVCRLILIRKWRGWSWREFRHDGARRQLNERRLAGFMRVRRHSRPRP
jgi:CRISPR-associated protein Cas1